MTTMVVADLNGTIGFYRDALGFDVELDAASDNDMGWAVLRRGDVVLLFQAATGLASDLLSKSRIEASGLVTYRVYVEDVPALYERVCMRVPILQRLQSGPEGAPEFSIRDCNGFVLTFVQA